MKEPKYSEFRDELKWYFDSDRNRFLEATDFLVERRNSFGYVDTLVDEEISVLRDMSKTERIEEMKRINELVEMASRFHAEFRKYKEKGKGRDEIKIGIFEPENTKSSIIVTEIREYDKKGKPFYYYHVYPTVDVEKKIEENILDDGEKYQRVL